jgi:hypothetical protein
VTKLDEHAFDTIQFLPEAVGFPQRRLVIVGDGRQERDHLNTVEATELGAELLLAQIEWTDVHIVIVLPGLTYRTI